MTDFETRPAGTADLVKRLRAGRNGQEIEAADHIEQLEAAIAGIRQNLEHWRQGVGKLHSRIATLADQLARANAATAAAIEVAARMIDSVEDAPELEDTMLSAVWDVQRAIRALATPDQTAALDRLIAEAEASVWEKAAEIVRHAVEVTGHRMREAKEKKNKKEERDWQSMLFCAVDIRTAILAASKKVSTP